MYSIYSGDSLLQWKMLFVKPYPNPNPNPNPNPDCNPNPHTTLNQ